MPVRSVSRHAGHPNDGEERLDHAVDVKLDRDGLVHRNEHADVLGWGTPNLRSTRQRPQSMPISVSLAAAAACSSAIGGFLPNLAGAAWPRAWHTVKGLDEVDVR